MSNLVVIFKSKYGATATYAKWIAEELSCDIFESKNIKADNLNNYDTIIYGGGLYAGFVNGIDLLTKNFAKLCNKKIVLFTCGLSDPTNKESRDKINNSLQKVLTKEMQEKIEIFNLRGGIDYSKLGFIHKLMMAMLHKIMTKKDYNTLSDEEKKMINSYGKAVDFVDKTAIAPIIEYVKKV